MEKQNIQSETVEETKVCSHDEEFALLDGRITLGGYHIQKKAMNDSFWKEMEVKIVDAKRLKNCEAKVTSFS